MPLKQPTIVQWIPNPFLIPTNSNSPPNFDTSQEKKEENTGSEPQQRGLTISKIQFRSVGSIQRNLLPKSQCVLAVGWYVVVVICLLVLFQFLRNHNYKLERRSHSTDTFGTEKQIHHMLTWGLNKGKDWLVINASHAKNAAGRVQSGRWEVCSGCFELQVPTSWPRRSWDAPRNTAGSFFVCGWTKWLGSQRMRSSEAGGAFTFCSVTSRAKVHP